MGLDADNEKHILFFVVVNSGMGSKVLKETKKVGVSGGTIFLGRGTVTSHILEVLGIDQAKKEIVLIVAQKKFESVLHDTVTEKFDLKKPNQGIAFSLSLNDVAGIEESGKPVEDIEAKGGDSMEYEAIFTIVDRGLGQEVVDVAKAAGARGATIINARGSGIHEEATFFSMRIEPEKEVVMIIIESDRAKRVSNAIVKSMKIDEPGKGILFGMDINRTSGILKEDK